MQTCFCRRGSVSWRRYRHTRRCDQPFGVGLQAVKKHADLLRQMMRKTQVHIAAVGGAQIDRDTVFKRRDAQLDDEHRRLSQRKAAAWLKAVIEFGLLRDGLLFEFVDGLCHLRWKLGGDRDGCWQQYYVFSYIERCEYVWVGRDGL